MVVADITLFHVYLQHNFEESAYYLNMLSVVILLLKLLPCFCCASVCGLGKGISSLSSHQLSRSSAEKHMLLSTYCVCTSS